MMMMLEPLKIKAEEEPDNRKAGADHMLLLPIHLACLCVYVLVVGGVSICEEGREGMEARSVRSRRRRRVGWGVASSVLTSHHLHTQ
jgi:hypothetical protein